MHVNVTLDPAAAWLLDGLADAPVPWIVLGDGKLPERALRLVITPGGPGAGRPLIVRGDAGRGAATLRVAAPDVVPAVAAVLLAVRDRIGRAPRLSCTWPSRRALTEILSLVDPAVFSVPRLRSLLRREEPVADRRPLVCAALS
jgi:hypothetical protein